MPLLQPYEGDLEKYMPESGFGRSGNFNPATGMADAIKQAIAVRKDRALKERDRKIMDAIMAGKEIPSRPEQQQSNTLMGRLGNFMSGGQTTPEISDIERVMFESKLKERPLPQPVPSPWQPQTREEQEEWLRTKNKIALENTPRGRYQPSTYDEWLKMKEAEEKIKNSNRLPSAVNNQAMQSAQQPGGSISEIMAQLGPLFNQQGSLETPDGNARYNTGKPRFFVNKPSVTIDPVTGATKITMSQVDNPAIKYKQEQDAFNLKKRERGAKLFQEKKFQVEARKNVIDEVNDTLSTIKEVEKGIDHFGVTGWIPAIPGTDKANWVANIDKLLAQKVFDKMNALKKSSRTGATGLGPIAVKEL